MDTRKRYHGLLASCIIATIFLASVINAGSQAAPVDITANQPTNNKSPGNSLLDPSAYLNGYHLYDAQNWFIPSDGDNFTLNFAPTWNVSRLSLNFFNGTLTSGIFENTTTVTTSVVTAIVGGYRAFISNLKVPANSTIYHAMFNITGLTMGDNSFWSTINGVSNSDYPVIDGNFGVAQRFLLPIYAVNLSIQVNLLRFESTVRDLIVEVRRSTSDNNVGELIKSVSVPYSDINLGSWWVTVSIPNVNLSAGYYFIVLHTDGWLNSGGGYVAQTTLGSRPTSPTPGFLTSNRGVNWQTQVAIAGSSYYFSGFKLKVHITTVSTPYSNIDLRINNIPVPDNHLWNQTVWTNVPPYTFAITSVNPITVLNFTYKVWYFVYGHDNPFRNGYHIQINSGKNTTSSSAGNYTLMRFTLEQSDLLASGVMNTTTGIITLNLKLANGSGAPLSGSVNVMAWTQMVKNVSGLTFGGPYSSVLQFAYTHPESSDNVTLSEAALLVWPINNQIDNVFLEGSILPANRWSYYAGTNGLTIFGEAFTSLPLFTLVGGSTINCAVSVFSNFTAAASASITGYLPDTSPTALISVQNATPMFDMDGLAQVNITITSPAGVVINNTELNLVGGQYVFNCDVTGEGIYGIKFISIDSIGHLATRWIGNATVNDLALGPPTITLSPASNLTSQQMMVISANASYISHQELAFDGNLTITVYVGSTGNVTQLTATWNSTTRLFEAMYQAPEVDSITQLSIRVQATDAKHRTSVGFTSTYVTPSSSGQPPQVEPSNLFIVLLGIVATLLLVPALAYLLEKRRKR